MLVPSVWMLIVVYFCALSIKCTNLQAISVSNDIDILPAPALHHRTNASQISILDEITHRNYPPPLNTTDALTSHAPRKIVKRSTGLGSTLKSTLNVFDEEINVQIELGAFGCIKIILFAILRVFFGITLNVSKLKQIIARPIGPTITILCHCIFLPMISYGFGWIFFADRATKRLDFFESGYVIGLHTFIFEPGYVTVQYKRYVVLVISHCLTLLFGGNIELSLMANVFIVLLSQFVYAAPLFHLYERVFNSDNVDNRFGPAALSGFNFVWPLCISIVLSLLGVLIQCVWPKSKPCATRILRRIAVLYVLSVLISAFSYLFIMFGASMLKETENRITDTSYVMESLKLIGIDILGYSVAIFGFIIGYILAKILRQKTDDSIAIAVESIPQNLCLDLVLLPLALCVCRCCRHRHDPQNDDENVPINACPENGLQNGSHDIELQK